MKISTRPAHRRLRLPRPFDRRRLNMGDPIPVEEATERIVNGAVVYARIKLFPRDCGRYVDLNKDQVTAILADEPGDSLTCFNIDLDGDLRVELHIRDEAWESMGWTERLLHTLGGFDALHRLGFTEPERQSFQQAMHPFD